MTDKSCANCPSFLREQDVPNKYARGIGAPMCARYGFVLGKPGLKPSQTVALQKNKAERCPSYGDPMPTQPSRENTMVMLPDPEVRDPANIVDTLKSACNTCASCKNFVPEGIVGTELGWSAGLCAAKGKLLFTNRLAAEAKDCEYRQWGQVRSSSAGLHFLPEYDEAFSTANPVTEYMKNKGKFIEPTEYPTDQEVTDEDKAGGIRAWRKVSDPDGSGKSTYLPIYETSYFSEEEQALIPKTGSDEHPELYVDHFGGVYGLAVAWMELDETPCLWGMAGTGKTELGRHLAWLMNVPFRRISITKSTEIDDVAGKMLYSPDKGTYFHYGRLSVAWTRPGVVCVDEPNTGQPEVWQFIRPMTDNSKQLVLDMNEAEALDRHQDCFPLMAMNPAWDPRNIGAMEIADADSNRLFHTFVDLPPEPLEREIIQARVKLDGWELSREQMDSVMKVAKDIRALSEDEALPITWAIRQQIKVARALRWFAPPTAYRRAVGDALAPEQVQVLMDQVKAHFPEVA